MVSRVIQYFKSKRSAKQADYTISWWQKTSAGWSVRSVEFKAIDVAHVKFGPVDFGPSKSGPPFFDIYPMGGPNTAEAHDEVHGEIRENVMSYWAMKDGKWHKFVHTLASSDESVISISSVTLQKSLSKLNKRRK